MAPTQIVRLHLAPARCSIIMAVGFYDCHFGPLPHRKQVCPTLIVSKSGGRKKSQKGLYSVCIMIRPTSHPGGLAYELIQSYRALHFSGLIF